EASLFRPKRLGMTAQCGDFARVEDVLQHHESVTLVGGDLRLGNGAWKPRVAPDHRVQARQHRRLIGDPRWIGILRHVCSCLCRLLWLRYLHATQAALLAASSAAWSASLG